MITVGSAISSDLQKNNYALIMSDEYSITDDLIDDKLQLWSDWNNLEPDNYLKDNGRFRLRRFGLFYLLPSTGKLVPFETVPYIQSRKVNAYAGGIKRNFAPLLNATLTNQFLHHLIKLNFQQFPVSNKQKTKPWAIDVHQFRIIASQNEQGQPTPEGIHRDGDDYNCVHLIGRQNVIGGENTVYNNNRKPLNTCTLYQPMDSILMCDSQVMHGVTPIQPENPSELAIRDVLVIGYNYQPNLKCPH